MINLYPSKEIKFPVIAECISPDIFDGKTLKEIEEQQIWEGNKQRKLGELFKVQEVKEENPLQKSIITVHGDVSKVRKIGAGMKSGEITIHGSAGFHLGEEMKGGRIVVNGNVGGWTGSMMKGGIIEIYGNAGDYLGAPYRGSSKGMRGGKIVIYGNVGSEAGAHMRKGIIKIYGSAGQFLGFRMCDGTIYVQKNAEARVGACMTSGKIVVGGALESVLPTFTIDGIKEKAKVDEEESVKGPFYLFIGDLTEHGDGKLFVFKEKNSHLSRYEKFL